jgi:hypothetical protein
MKLGLLFVGAAIALTSCSNDGHTNAVGLSFAGPTSISAALGVRLSPERLTGTSLFFASCPFSRAFRTSFDVIAIDASNVNRLDHVTVRLLDGTHLGPTITFPQPLLDSMFGSTRVIGTRAFRFTPEFGCLSMTPRSLLVGVGFRELTGRTQTFTLQGAFQ